MKEQTNASLNVLSTFDLLEKIVEFLDSEDIEMLWMTCRTMLVLSNDNCHYVYNWLIRALIRELKLPINFRFERSERRLVYTGLRQLKYHFCSHPETPIADYLCYMVERTNQCDTLFNRLVDTVYTDAHNTIRLTDSTAHRHTKTLLKPLRFLITSSDMVYILVHGNSRIARAVLLHICVSAETLKQAIDGMICQSLNHERVSKIEILTQHFLAKACFPSLSRQQQSFFNKVLFALIQGFHNTAFQRILLRVVKYRGFVGQLQYQLLINKCLEHDNLKGLIVCFDHMHIYSPSSKITVNPQMVSQMVERGRTKSLNYVIDHLLGKTINMKVYVNSICSGLARSNKPDPFLLQSVAHYFTDTNLVLINQYLALAGNFPINLKKTEFKNSDKFS